MENCKVMEKKTLISKTNETFYFLYLFDAYLTGLTDQELFDLHNYVENKTMYGNLLQIDIAERLKKEIIEVMKWRQAFGHSVFDSLLT